MPKSNEHYSESETVKRREDALKRMLATPHKPHNEARKPRKKKAKSGRSGPKSA